MTTATKRLRRASIAGLATIATVGGGLALTGGTALAFTTATSTVNATVTPGASASLNAGASGQALGNIKLEFPANSGAEEFIAGEQVTFTLDSDGAGPAATKVNDGSNTLNTASFAAAPTVTGTNGGTATVALANANGTNDQITLTFTSNAAENTTVTDFTLSGLSVNLGSKVDPGQTISVDVAAATGVNKSIFWNGAATATTSVAVGTLPQANVTTSKVTVISTTATSANLGVISIKAAVAGAISNGDALQLEVSDGTWTTAPTATGTPAVTVAIDGGNAAILDITAGADAAAGNIITLTGGVLGLTGGTAESVTAELSNTTTGFGIDPTVQVVSVVDQNRLGGSDRYATAGLLFGGNTVLQTNLGVTAFNSTSVVLTSGANFPDALSAVYLAKELSTGGNHVGVLTTDPNSLSGAAQQQILHQNGGTIDTVYIVGGTAAVSANVANQIAALHVGNVATAANVSVVRIGGADRYATNNLADLYLGAVGTSTAFIATGANFADALSIGPAVYATGNPLILTDGAALSDSAKSTLQNLGITDVVVVGGSAAISSAVTTAITNLGITVDTTLSGADRTQTAAAVEGYETAATFNNSHPFSIGNVYIARGDNFADALVAGPVAALSDTAVGNPILLTGDPNTLGAGIPSVLGGEAGHVTSISALGLTGAISVGTLNAAAAALS